MRKAILLIAACMAGNIRCAELFDDLLNAHSLMIRRKFAAAAELYRKVAATAGDAGQLQTAQLYQAICLGRTRRKAEALKAASALKDASLREYAEMSIIADSGNSGELVKRFAGTDLDAWPEQYVHYGWYLRGRALVNINQYERGMKELLKAVELSGSDLDAKMAAWMDIAAAAHNAKNDDLALQYTGKSLKNTRYADAFLFLRPMCIQAEILIMRKQFDEAEKTLSLALPSVSRKKGTWGCRFQLLKGDIALGKGDKENAKKCYEQARVNAGNDKRLLKECNKRIRTVR